MSEKQEKMDDPSPHSDSRSDTSSIIYRLPITPLMRHKGYKVRRPPDGTNPAPQTNADDSEDRKEDNVSVTLNLGKESGTKSQNSIDSIALNLKVTAEKGQEDGKGNDSEKRHGLKEHEEASRPNEHQCFASEMDDNANMATGESSSTGGCKAPLTFSEIDLGGKDDTGLGDGKKFPCMYCEKNFSRKDSRKRHEKLHATDTETDRTTETIGAIPSQSNQSTKKDDDPTLSIKVEVGDELKPVERKLGGEAKTGSPQEDENNLYFPCLYCFKSFSRKDSLKRHERIHTAELESAYKMSQTCGETAGALHALPRLSSQSVGRRVDPLPPITVDVDDVDIKTGFENDKKVMFTCMYCEKSFSRNDSRKRHEKVHTNDEYFDGAYDAKKPRTDGENAETLDAIPCFSSQFTDQKVDPLSSVKIEIGDEVQPVTPEPEVEDEFEESQEDGKKLFPCMYCDKSFSRKDSRKRHERIHTQDKPHKCCFCEKTFITRSHMKEHESVHTGVRDYVCNFCDKAFVSTDKRKRHEKTHLSPVIPVVMTSVDKVPLVDHNMIPLLEDVPNSEKPDQIEENGITQFVCRFCPKTFPRVDSRKRHERTHTGQKPHICSFCGHSFVTAYHKRLHERTHTKEKPHMCSICNKGFSRMDSLKRHEKVHDSIAVEMFETQVRN